MKKIKGVVLLGLLIGFISCVKKKQSADKEPHYRFEEVATYTEENLPEGQLIGRIQAIAVDDLQSLYILDSGLKHIVKFDKEGSFMRILANGEGRGPGEFLSPVLLSVDENERVYVFDRNMQKIVVLSAENEFITEFSLNHMPSRMASDAEGNLYVTNYGVPFPIEGDKIFKYMPDENGSYQLSERFASISKTIDTRKRGLAGNTDKFAFRSPDILYFALWYPYEIRTYTTDGDSLDVFGREVSFFREPEGKPGELISAAGSVADILPFKDGLLASRLKDNSKADTTIYYIDFWNRKGKLLGSFDESETGIFPGGMNFVSYGDEFLYVAYNAPAAKVIKYRLVKK